MIDKTIYGVMATEDAIIPPRLLLRNFLVIRNRYKKFIKEIIMAELMTKAVRKLSVTPMSNNPMIGAKIYHNKGL